MIEEEVQFYREINRRIHVHSNFELSCGQVI